MPKKGDFVVAVAVFLLALLPLLFLWTPKGNTAVVRVDGEAALRIDLDRDGLYPVQTPYGENLLQVEEGAHLRGAGRLPGRALPEPRGHRPNGPEPRLPAPQAERDHRGGGRL